MHMVWFLADDPLMTLPRALDVLRRMGFELCGLEVDAAGEHGETASATTLKFRVRGGRTAANLADRLRQIPGVDGLTWRRAAPGLRRGLGLVEGADGVMNDFGFQHGHDRTHLAPGSDQQTIAQGCLGTDGHVSRVG